MGFGARQSAFYTYGTADTTALVLGTVYQNTTGLPLLVSTTLQVSGVGVVHMALQTADDSGFTTNVIQHEVVEINSALAAEAIGNLATVVPPNKYYRWIAGANNTAAVQGSVRVNI